LRIRLRSMVASALLWVLPLQLAWVSAWVSLVVLMLSTRRIPGQDCMGYSRLSPQAFPVYPCSHHHRCHVLLVFRCCLLFKFSNSSYAFLYSIDSSQYGCSGSSVFANFALNSTRFLYFFLILKINNGENKKPPKKIQIFF